MNKHARCPHPLRRSLIEKFIDMDASSSQMARQAALREIVLQHYPDAHRISVDLSATGVGHHLRWHYSEDLIDVQQAEIKQEREPSPDFSHASTVLVDQDGDSQMGDEGERLQTPSRESPFDPGSVVLTPKKQAWRGLSREPRMGGGFDWWHNESGVEERVAFIRDPSQPPQQSAVQPATLGPDALVVYQQLEKERERHGGPSSQHRKPPRNLPPRHSDDAVSVSSIATDATVILDNPKKNAGKPTLFNGEQPIVRQPATPDEYKQNGKNRSPNKQGAGNLDGQLSTIQEEGSGVDMSAWAAPRVPDFGQMRIFQDDKGQWMRDGSLGPDASYKLDRKLLPPRVEMGPPQAGPSRAKAVVPRGDTEEVETRHRHVRFVPFVEIPMRKIKRAVEPPSEAAPPAPTLRRSARLRAAEGLKPR